MDPYQIEKILNPTQLHKMIKDIKKFYQKTKLNELMELESPPIAYSHRFYKDYPRLPSIALPEVELSGNLGLEDLFDKRKSVREFSYEGLSFEEIAKIFRSHRILDFERDPERRTYPSGGARFPVETYLVSFNVEDLVPGAYHYNIKENELERLLEKNLREKEKEIVSPPLDNPSAAIVLTSAISRMEVKYGHKAYPYSFIEAGHISQNLHLACTQEDIGFCCVGGFIDDTIIEILDLTENEIPLYVMGIGKPKD